MKANAQSLSSEVNKVLVRVLLPVIKQNGFQKVQARTAWGWHGDCIWVLKIKSVGWRFSQVTGYPTMSLTVETGVFYTFFPTSQQISLDTTGRLLPQEHECQIRSELHSTLNQKSLKHALTNKAERERTDVWWVQPDLSNTEEVVANIRDVFLSDGISWFNRYSDLDTAYASVKAERDCLDKYLKAVQFAKCLGHSQEYELFRRLARQEGSRIRNSMPWFGELNDLD